MATNAIRPVQSTPVRQALLARTYSQSANSKLVKKVTHVSNPVITAKPSVSDHVINHQYIASDGSWAMRPLDNPTVDGGLRQTTVIPAVINYLQASKQGAQAEKIGDQTGKTLSRMSKVGSGIQMVYALGGIAGKVAALWSVFKPSPAVLAVGSTLGKILGYLAIPLYLIPAISGAYQAKNARAFYKEYEAHNKSFKFLVNSIYVQDPDALLVPANHEHLRDVARKALQERPITDIDKLIEEFDLATYEEYYIPKLGADALSAVRSDPHVFIGFLLELKNKQECNETTVGRVIGSDCVASVKRNALKGLQARLKDVNPLEIKAEAQAERAELQAKIETNYTKIQSVNVALTILSVATVVLGAIAIALLITNPIAMAVLWTVIALAWVVFDIYAAEQFEGQPGKLDKLLLKFLTAIVVIGGGISLGLAIAAGGPVTIAMAAVILLILLGNSAYSFNKLNKLEAKWKAEHPTLADLQAHLKTAHTPEETHAFFKQLDKFDRQTLTDQAAARSLDPAFGANYVRSFFQNNKNFDSHVDLLKRATKKARKHYWTAFWYRSQDVTAKAHALQLQSLLHAIEKRQWTDVEAQYDKLEPEARATLHNQITRVFYRDMVALRPASSS